jgi:hypothetical protein
MKKFVAAVVVFVLLVSQASAYWATRLVPETHTVTVHPNPYWTQSGWAVPAPYNESRTRWVEKCYWVEPPPPIYVAPAPIYIAPAPIYFPPYCPPYCPR